MKKGKESRFENHIAELFYELAIDNAFGCDDEYVSASGQWAAIFCAPIAMDEVVIKAQRLNIEVSIQDLAIMAELEGGVVVMEDSTSKIHVEFYKNDKTWENRLDQLGETHNACADVERDELELEAYASKAFTRESMASGTVEPTVISKRPVKSLTDEEKAKNDEFLAKYNLKSR